MSKVVITGNASGTGDFTIAAPNSNTDRTLTLPDVSGTLVTGDDITINGITSDYTSGTALNIDSSGRVTTPQQVSFRAEKTVDENLVAGTSLKVTFDSLAYDVGNNFSLAGKQFVAPVTGKYMFSTGFRVDSFDTAAGYYIIKINVSNGSYQWIIDPNFSSDLSFLTLNLDAIADMDANDVAYVTIFQSSGTASHVHGSLTYDWFSGHLLG